MHSINYFVSVQTQLKFQVLFVKTAGGATAHSLISTLTGDSANGGIIPIWKL